MLEQFVKESNRIEGIDYTHPDHIRAHRVFLSKPVTIDTLVALVSVLQPDAVLRDRVDVPGVRVGNHIAPPSGPTIRTDLESILTIDDVWQQHIDYETLHPFTDGNGRSGRALWLHRHNGRAPIGFLHAFYYQTLARSGR